MRSRNLIVGLWLAIANSIGNVDAQQSAKVPQYRHQSSLAPGSHTYRDEFLPGCSSDFHRTASLGVRNEGRNPLN